MAVVIQDFETLPAAPAAASKPASAAEAAAPEKLEPCAVDCALRSLEAQALRAWAH